MIKNIDRAKYIDCVFGLDKLNECCINGIRSTAQTIRNLPFLTFDYEGFRWNPKIDINTGEVLFWPKGRRAVINFNIKWFSCTYLDYEKQFIGTENKEIPFYLQRDLIDTTESLNFIINRKGFIENWPTFDEILKQLSLA